MWISPGCCCCAWMCVLIWTLVCWVVFSGKIQMWWNERNMQKSQGCPSLVKSLHQCKHTVAIVHSSNNQVRCYRLTPFAHRLWSFFSYYILIHSKILMESKIHREFLQIGIRKKQKKKQTQLHRITNRFQRFTMQSVRWAQNTGVFLDVRS